MDGAGPIILPFKQRSRVAVFLLALLVCAGFVLGYVKQADWQVVYVEAAWRLRAGKELFRQGFYYPPFAAMLALPWTWVGPKVGQALWALVNVGAASFLVTMAWRFSQIQGARRGTRRGLFILALGWVAAGGYLLDAFTNGQTDLLIAALVMAGCWLLVRNQARASAVPLGLAAAVKCTPLLFGPYLAWRRQWLAAASLLLIAVGVNFLPDLIQPRSQLHLVRWTNHFLVPVSSRDVDPGVWAAAIDFNHSLSGSTSRLLGMERERKESQMRARPAASRPSARTLHTIRNVTAVALLAVVLLACRRTPRNETNRRIAQGLEFSMVLILMLLLSPMSSKPHFCTLFLPTWLLARLALEKKDRKLLGLVIVTALLGLGMNKDLVGGAVYDHLKWYGAVTLQCLLLLGGCAWMRWRVALAQNSEPVQVSPSESLLLRAA